MAKLKKSAPKNVRRRKKSYRKPTGLSKRLIQRTKAAGLPDPTTCTKAQFIKLQKQWYAKLADSGFKDLEWVDHSTGQGHDGPHLRGSLHMGKTYHPGRALYYDIAMSYLQCKALRGYRRFIWKLHAMGHTYDHILERLHKVYTDVPSKYTLYYELQHLAKLAYKWNASQPDGVLYKRAEDAKKLAESFLAEIQATHYNWIMGEEKL